MTRVAEGGAGVLRWKVGGMDCASCATRVREALGRTPGVEDVSLSVMTETLSLRLDESRASRAAIERKVQALGFTTTPLAAEGAAGLGRDHPREPGHEHDPHHDHDHDHGGGSDGHSHEGHSHSGHTHAPPAPGLLGLVSTGKGLVALTGALVALAWIAGLVFPGAARWLFVAACLIGLAPIARRAVAAAAQGSPFTIEMLMSVAAIGALFIGAAEEAAFVVFLFAIGEVLEGVAADRARASIRALGALIPKTALVEEAGAVREIPASALRVGQIAMARPGDRIACDGEVVDGVSGVDESPVTGESVPATKRPGDPVYAGSVNQEAALRIRVASAAADNTIARIIRLVEEAQEARAPTERFIDRFSRVYMPFVVALAALVAIGPPMVAGGAWETWIYRGLALLLIGCPCALVISVPAAIAAALSAGARQGLLMKGGAVVERAARVATVAFDKTGTLTEGRPRVTEIVAAGHAAPAVLEFAAALESGSSHPLARAILDHAAARSIVARPAADMTALPGEGVAGRLDGASLFVGSPGAAMARAPFDARAQAAVARLESDGMTVAAVLADGALAGLIALRDEPRPDAAPAIADLKALGVGATMLTGDNSRAARAIAASLGLEAKAELKPRDKAMELRALSARGPVMMIGDGINDAPALAAADVGLAMGNGADVALETADGALLHSRLRDAAAMIRLARATMANIRVNIAIALGLKAVFLVTTVFGYTGLWPAILADTGATVLVTANALRLLGFRAQPEN